MNWYDWPVAVIIGLCLGLVGVLVFAGVQGGRSSRPRGVDVRWPVDIPGTMTVGDIDYAFSPTGGYVHITYKPKEESR